MKQKEPFETSSNLNSNLNSFFNLSTSEEISEEDLPKEPLQSCFVGGNLAGIAKCLALCGFTPIPLKALKENGEIRVVPAIPWKNFKIDGLSLENLKTLRKIFSQKGICGIALRCGEASNLLILDVDDPEKFNNFYSLEKLKKEASYVVKTKDEGHYHFGFLWDPEFSECKNFLDIAGFEIKTNGSLANFYTILPDFWYKPLKLEPLNPLPQELKEKIKKLISQKESFSFSKTKTQKEDLILKDFSLVENILTILEPYYYRGQRQFFVLFVSGLLKKLGVPEEITLEKLKAFCEDKKDEELLMRMEAIKYTYKKPEEEITGLRGLEETLGVKEEDILRLKALIRNYKGEKKGSFEEFYDNLSYTPPKSGWEILNKTYEPPKWLLEPFIPEGITVIGGKWKIGKSFFALQITCELALRGKRVLHYGLEDTEERLNSRLNLLLGDTKPEFVKNIFFRTREDKVPRIGKGGLKYLKIDVQNFKPDIVVIDPFLAIKPRGRGKDIFLEDYEAIQIFRDITDQKINILIIHHTRKTQAEDIADELAGSGGFLASPDNIGVLKRDRYSEIGYFTLYPRDFDIQEWALAFKKGRWEFLGKKEEIAMAEEQKKIIEALKELGGEASPKEVAGFLNKNYHTTHNLMNQLVNKGILKRTQRGKYSFCDNSYGNYSNYSNYSKCSKCSKSPFENFTISSPSYSKSYSNFQSPPDLGSEPFTIFTINTINIAQKNFPTSTQTQPPTPTPTSSLSEEKTQPEEGDIIYLLVPPGQACAKCKIEGTENRVFKFTKEVYDNGKGIGTCLRCGAKSLFLGLWDYKVLAKEEVPWFALYPHKVEAKATLRISKDGKVEIEGGKIANPELFQQLQNAP